MKALRAAAGGAAARLTAFALRLFGRGGTSLPGRVLLAVDPDAIADRAASLPRGSFVVSATNGKTTTCSLIAGALVAEGLRPVHNRAGANMAGGIASTLLSEDGDVGLFEVDEFWLDRLVPQIRPKVLLLSNLFRDQLDRYGELDAIVSRWKDVADSGQAGALVLNSDDPSIAAIGEGASSRPVFFGLRDEAVASAEAQHAAEQVVCPTCGGSLEYRSWTVGHLGSYRCPSCGWARPDADVFATDIRLRGLSGSSFVLEASGERRAVEIPLPGLYNVYNAVGAAAAALTGGCRLDAVVEALGATSAVFGRAETVSVGGRDCSILLVKNPAGANEVIRTVGMEAGSHDCLFVLNDQIADGRDVSWIWDADFEAMADSVGTATCSGTRAVEMATRLKYAGVDEDRISVVDDLSDALAAAASGEGDRLLVLPTYTAMLQLRELLAGRGAVEESFA